ncbi:arsenic resistance protein [Rubrobacter indicoceani]|uniref:arsenic resistance protein n=1 Tax=Rubrobacter indicoceani TaxID=2051957 RepID=UPI001968E817|nr:arsenic resistance protein [Rubrobacter indicoceani]
MLNSPNLKERLERYQVWIYAAALFVGTAVGLVAPGADSFFERAIYPVLGVLLYVTFLQVPFTELKGSITSGRFLAAVLALNFVFVPILVFGLTRFVASEPAVLIGVLLVLLTPCIDYVIVFSELGGGDAKKVTAATPLLMISQIATLPVYLWLFLGSEALSIFSAGPFLEAFFILVVLPLGFAIGTQYLAGSNSKAGTLTNRWTSFAGYLPVPFLAFTLLAMVASQIPRLEGVLD